MLTRTWGCGETLRILRPAAVYPIGQGLLVHKRGPRLVKR